MFASSFGRDISKISKTPTFLTKFLFFVGEIQREETQCRFSSCGGSRCFVPMFRHRSSSGGMLSRPQAQDTNGQLRDCQIPC